MPNNKVVQPEECHLELRYALLELSLAAHLEWAHQELRTIGAAFDSFPSAIKRANPARIIAITAITAIPRIGSLTSVSISLLGRAHFICYPFQKGWAPMPVKGPIGNDRPNRDESLALAPIGGDGAIAALSHISNYTTNHSFVHFPPFMT
jgi:hypothetical protein